jgi:adenine-specific DNA-methyltransferase
MAPFFSQNKNIPKYITALARENRVRPTPQEDSLWHRLSNRQLCGLKFRRQFPIGRYIVDFYNHSSRLVIEIDGGVHSVSKKYDKNRDAYLNSSGCTVLRIGNSEVETDIEKVLTRIAETARLQARSLD